jgi:hypothetical protein
MSIFELLQKHPIRGFRSGEDYSMAVRELLLRLGYTPVPRSIRRETAKSAGNVAGVQAGIPNPNSFTNWKRITESCSHFNQRTTSP